MINESLILDPESLLDSRDGSRVDEEKELKALFINLNVTSLIQLHIKDQNIILPVV